MKKNIMMIQAVNFVSYYNNEETKKDFLHCRLNFNGQLEKM